MAPAPSEPRLEREKLVNAQYPKTKYRQALPSLLRETGERCGYSLQHVLDLGRKSMEVDHFNPELRHPFRNRHGNLIAASRHCNGAKSDTWPSTEDREVGLYLINPYEEEDYGKHIIEDRATGSLRGKTVAGKWHIEILDLNAAHLVTKRLDRTLLRNTFLAAAMASGTDSTNELLGVVFAKLQEAQASMLPIMIPELPAD
jgi:hypothetical protein